MKLVLFDCDDTLWDAPHGDYISSVPSTFTLGGSVLVRDKDKAVFSLKHGVLDLVKSLHKNGCIIGIVSDNIKEPVPYISKAAINVRLWKGPCPKEIMVQEILAKPFAKNILPKDVLWLDDKDYAPAAEKIGVNFYHVTKGDTLNIEARDH
jgi:predicted phosphatase